MNPYFFRTYFEKSCRKLNQLPSCDQRIEIAFAGRSNAGKSSALNTITNQKSLARTSKIPGRTQLINLFPVDEKLILVDLPGYGYSNVHAAIRQGWSKLLSGYIEQRQCLAGIILVMDIRHPLKPTDQQMLTWTQYLGLPVHVLLTKADKLPRGQAKNTLLKTTSMIGDNRLVSVQLFSSLKKQGVDEAHAKLEEWFEMNHAH